MSINWFAAARQQDTVFLTRNNQLLRSRSPKTGRTALMHAMQQAAGPVMQILRREVGMADALGRTALHYAAFYNNIAAFTHLGDERGTRCL